MNPLNWPFILLEQMILLNTQQARFTIKAQGQMSMNFFLMKNKNVNCKNVNNIKCDHCCILAFPSQCGFTVWCINNDWQSQKGTIKHQLWSHSEILPINFKTTVVIPSGGDLVLCRIALLLLSKNRNSDLITLCLPDFLSFTQNFRVQLFADNTAFCEFITLNTFVQRFKPFDT